MPGASQFFYRIHLRGRQRDTAHLGNKSLHGWAWAVQRQLQLHGNISQLFLPVIQFALECLFIQGSALPQGKIGILHRKRRQRIRAPAVECFIQCHQFTVKYPL